MYYIVVRYLWLRQRLFVTRHKQDLHHKAWYRVREVTENTPSGGKPTHTHTHTNIFMYIYL